ncbi:ATP synthase subunit b, mitochondrial [Cephus cinctus]|uniref:ATP synthase subunit b n=1 Tax=Cephus cinctus TaxID=211228 RepID=A0AAJ7C2M3_CEPCN|nr:ATP synthase subunit b, mitochondrial [Cephus cinctus]
MLSRLALRNAQLMPIMARGAQSMSSAAGDRPVRMEKPSPVRHGIIPEEWFTIFYPKTGVTGPYMFGIGLSTYLLSKEIYVLEHEYYTGVSIFIMALVVIKKLGPTVAAALDKQIDKYEGDWESSRTENMKSLEECIENEKKEQWRADGQKLLIQAKKENIVMQLEATYRERLATVYNEVKKRLDYQVNIQAVERRLAQKQMVQWIISNVLKSITPEQEKANLQQCIADLQSLAPRA